MSFLNSNFYWPKQNDWALIHFQGQDASDFLHRLTTLDVSKLNPGQGGAGFFLNPQGKILTAFLLFKESIEHFYFELAPGSDRKFIEKLSQTIDFFTFGEKVHLSQQSGKKCVWIFQDNPQNDFLIKNENDLMTLDHGNYFFGKNWISIWGDEEKLNTLIKNSKAISADSLEKLRIENLNPWWDHEIRIESNPLEIGFDFGISPNKGCYPGQEVIEKIISLGSPAKRLVSISLSDSSALKLPCKITSEQIELGELTTQQGALGLGVIRKTNAKIGNQFLINNQPSEVTQVKDYLK